MADKQRLSSSSLNTLFMCGHKYYLRHVQGLRMPKTLSLQVGLSVHHSAERNLLSYLNAQTYLPLEEAQTIATDDVKRFFRTEEYILLPEEAELGLKKIKGLTVDEVAALATKHHADVAPAIDPIAVERRWRMSRKGYPFEITGKTDVEQPKTVADLKTVHNAPRKDAAHISFQLTLYAIQFFVHYGYWPKYVRLDNLVRNKTPTYVPQFSTRNEQHVEAFYNRLDIAAEVIGKEAWLPARPEDPLCSPKYCEYYKDICEYAHGWKQFSLQEA